VGLAALAVAASAHATLEIPPLEGRVNDRAGVLSRQQATDLERRLARFEDETSHQIVVLTLPTLAGEPIEEFALRVAESWEIGRAGLDNGIVLVVVPDDREARIEVGYGLEGVVPDAIAKRVLEDVMFPRFRSGDLAGGIEAGVAALMKAARGEAIPNERRSRGRRGAWDPLSAVFFSSLLASFVAIPFRRSRRRALGAAVGAVVSGGLTYLFLHLLGWTALAFGVGALFAWFATSENWEGGGGGLGDYGWGGGWSGGGGGGGFGGGGGGFGGGGASGRW
jgi:uncharacterized protein